MAIPERFTTCGTTVKFNSSPAGAFRMETWSVHQHEGPAQQTMGDNSHGTMHGTMITLPRRPEQRDCRRSGPPALRLDRACTPGAADQSPHGGENKNPVAAACVNLGHSTRWSTPGVVGRAVVSPAGAPLARAPINARTQPSLTPTQQTQRATGESASPGRPHSADYQNTNSRARQLRAHAADGAAFHAGRQPPPSAAAQPSRPGRRAEILRPYPVLCQPAPPAGPLRRGAGSLGM